MNKYILKDMKEFSLLQKVLVIIDLMLNPRATTYPFLYTDIDIDKEYIGLEKHLIIKEFDKDGKHWLWCIRWL